MSGELGVESDSRVAHTAASSFRQLMPEIIRINELIYEPPGFNKTALFKLGMSRGTVISAYLPNREDLVLPAAFQYCSGFVPICIFRSIKIGFVSSHNLILASY